MVFSEVKDKVIERIRELGKLTPIALVTLLLPIGGLIMLYYFGKPIAEWLRMNEETGVIIYFLGVVILCGLALMATNVIGFMGGWAFGFYIGGLALILGVVGSAVLSFYIHRRIIGNKLPDLAEKNPKANAIYNELVKGTWLKSVIIILLVRSSIIMPFAFTNFLMASAKVKLSAYIIGTFGGMLPRSTAMALAGAGVAEFTTDNPTDTWGIALGLSATVLMIILIAHYSRRALKKMVLYNIEEREL